MNLCILNSPRRTGWCEFSARLFLRSPCSWRAERPSSDFAAPYDLSLSVTSTWGAKPCVFSNLRMSLAAAALLRRRCTSRSRTLALAVHRSPQPELLAADHHGHLVEMPLRSGAGATAAKLSSKKRSELQYPASDGLVGDLQAALREQFLNVAIAEREPDIQPHCVPDDRGGKLVTSE